MVLVFSSWLVWGQFHRFEGIEDVTYLQEVRAADLSALWAAGGLGPNVPQVSMAGLLTRIYRNVAWYQVYNADGLIWPYADRLAELRTPGLGLFLAALGLLPAIIGAAVLLFRSPPLVAWLVGSIVLAVLYPTGGAPRMLLASVPILLLAFYAGLEPLLGRRFAVAWMMCALVAGTVTCAVQARFQAARPYFGSPYDDASTTDAINLILEDVPRLTPEHAVVVGDYERVVKEFTDRVGRPRAALGSDIGTAQVFIVDTEARRLSLPPGLRRTRIADRGGAELAAVGPDN
jgi:hypothetical protein